MTNIDIGTPGEMISRIIELQAEIDHTRLWADAMIPLAFIFIGMIATMCLIRISTHYRSRYDDDLVFWTSILLIFASVSIGAILIGSLMAEFLYLPPMESALDRLVTAYEALYGPLPPGVIG